MFFPFILKLEKEFFFLNRKLFVQVAQERQQKLLEELEEENRLKEERELKKLKEKEKKKAKNRLDLKKKKIMDS